MIPFYSCSNDGTIKLFALDLKEKDILVKDDQIEFSKVFYSNGWLYSADNEGNVKLFKNNKFFDSFNVAEAIKDMVVSNNIVYTVKDVDLNITGKSNLMVSVAFFSSFGYPQHVHAKKTKYNLSGEKLQYGSKKVFMGKAPVALGAHEMIINTLAGTKWNQRTVLFSGGWDKLVKWNIDEDIVKLESQLDVEIVVNSIAIGDRGEIYVGGGDGHIVRVEIE
ncbi:hypothetical protein NQ317_009882 [Molorchus minor]|uniref:Uncharacterized protein n=1 Tax=Molorchus minor TaxID=1323400 RepID=A0ABQ9K450_9CUCU|nr:hypothetical protein NQ317_009882 [Molorchus minor]